MYKERIKLIFAFLEDITKQFCFTKYYLKRMLEAFHYSNLKDDNKEGMSMRYIRKPAIDVFEFCSTFELKGTHYPNTLLT